MKIPFYGRVLFVICLLALGFVLRSFPYDHGNFSKDSPMVITTYDAFYHTIYAKAAYDNQGVNYWPSSSIYSQKTVWLQPPMLYVYMASMKNLTTMPLYRMFYVLISLLGVWFSFMLYVLFRKYFGETIALVSLAFSLITTANWFMFHYMGFVMDFVAFIVFPFILYLVLEFQKKPGLGIPLLAGFLMGFSFLAHSYQAVFFMMNLFIALFFALLLRFMPFKSLWKFWLLSGITFLLMLSPYISRFYVGYFNKGGGTSTLIQLGEYSPFPNYFWPMSYSWILIMGFIIFGIYLISSIKELRRDHYRSMLLLFVSVGILMYFLNYLGFSGTRVSRYHFVMFHFIVLLAAIGFMSVINTLMKHPVKELVVWFLIGIYVFFVFTVAFQYLSTNPQNDFLSPDEKWDALAFVRDKTPKDARVFFFYGYFHYYQGFAERSTYNVELGRDYTQQTYQALCSGVMPDVFYGDAEITNHYFSNESQALINLNGFTPTTIPLTNRRAPVNITDFDYVVTQYKGIPNIQPCVDFFIKNIESMNFTPVFKNSLMVVYQNGNKHN